MVNAKDAKKIKKLTGAVSVDGDVTPTLRQKIENVDANDWANMTIAELWEQRTTLNTRMIYAQQSNHPEIVPQIQRGINYIDQLLRDRESEIADGRLY